MPAITGTAAAIAEFGADPITGITWGRYSAGNFATVDRVTGLPIGNGSTAENAINHYLLTPFQLGPTVLPLSGSATYTLIGATSPTDTAGFVGTLNSATLNANFSAKTVDTSLAATVGPRTWSASASGVPILNGSAFEASRFGTNGTLNVSCSGAGCNPAAVAGSVTGVFVGPTGQGAGVAYSLNSGGSGGVTMGGVAAFRR
jgi:hypothetical protein